MRTMNYDSKGNLRQTVDNGKYAKDFNYDENGNFLYAVDYIGNVEQEVLTHERYIGSFTCPYFQFMCKFFNSAENFISFLIKHFVYLNIIFANSNNRLWLPWFMKKILGFFSNHLSFFPLRNRIAHIYVK